MPRTRSLAGLCAAILVAGTLAAACGTGGSASPSPATTPSGAAPSSLAGAACETAPAPSDMSAWGPPATSPTLFPLLVTNYVTCGKARILFLYLDASNNVASAPDRTASVAFYDLGRDPDKAVATAEGKFIWTIQDERGMYIADVDLPEAGIWGAEITTEAPGSPAETVRMTFEVHDTSPTVAVGDVAPASDTPTLEDVDGDVTLISTDADPVPDFYSTSVADALAAHQPFVLVFATPKFCTSAQCGPTLDRLKPLAAEHPEVTFINVEPYQLQVVDGQLQPLLDANGGLQAADVTNEWGLLTEPWIFAVDRAGIVRGSYELIVSDDELDAALAEITAEG
ncbi:MAG: hypothetical protein WEE50_04375 [Chloroflexota bacterium]